jgi:hypothetical protein
MEKATYQLSNQTTSGLVKKLLVGRTFCDLSEVFVFVNHDPLLLNLNWYGITDKTSNWIKSYTLWTDIKGWKLVI